MAEPVVIRYADAGEPDMALSDVEQPGFFGIASRSSGPVSAGAGVMPGAVTLRGVRMGAGSGAGSGGDAGVSTAGGSVCGAAAAGAPVADGGIAPGSMSGSGAPPSSASTGPSNGSRSASSTSFETATCSGAGAPISPASSWRSRPPIFEVTITARPIIAVNQSAAGAVLTGSPR